MNTQNPDKEQPIVAPATRDKAVIPGHLPVEKNNVKTVVQDVIKSFEQTRQKEFKLYQELEALADYINTTKTEISSIKPADISKGDIPDAKVELSEVVGATEKATGEILDACDEIQNNLGSCDETTKTLISNNIVRVFEACNFQDITGQRITKVVTALQKIDYKLNALLVAFGDHEADHEKSQKLYSMEEAEREKRQQEHLLNGPQVSGEAIKQSDVDSLFD